MAKVPTQVVIAAYHDEAAADEVAKALKKAKRRLLVYYRNVAVIRKDDKGKVKIKETGDMSGGVGAGVGAVVGGALGILAGPAWLPELRPEPLSVEPERRFTMPASPTSAWIKLAACFNPATRPSSPSSRKPRSTRRR